MKTFTAHLRPGRPPVLVRESWSWGAALFGPFWLLLHRAWIPAALYGAAVLGAAALPDRFRLAASLGLALLAGLCGRDMVRWSLGRRGYALAHVVAARNEEAALFRLYDSSPSARGSVQP